MDLFHDEFRLGGVFRWVCMGFGVLSLEDQIVLMNNFARADPNVDSVLPIYIYIIYVKI